MASFMRETGRKPPAASYQLDAEPPPGDLELAAHVRNLFYAARSARRQTVARWNRSYQVLQNRAVGVSFYPGHVAPTVPEIYPIVAAMVGWMTDRRPTVNIQPWMPPATPEYPTLSRIAQDLNLTITSTWNNHHYSSEIEQVCWDGFVCGAGILKAVWDATLDEGMGNASLRRVDPYTFYPDAHARSMDDASYFCEVRHMSIQELDRRFPGAGRHFVGSGTSEDIDTRPDREESESFSRGSPGAIPPATYARYGRPGEAKQFGRPEHDAGVTLIECWMRQHYLTDSETPTVIDGWRVVVVCGNHVLMDEDAEALWGHGRHPYTRYVPHQTDSFWGLSMVEMLTPLQLAINRTLAALQSNVELTGNPVWIETARSGITRAQMTSKPGSRIQINEGGRGEWIYPPTANPQMQQLVTFYINEMERIAGLSAITRGQTPTGRNTEEVLDRVQEASFVRIRMALRNLELSLQEQLTLIANLIVENYTEPRFISVLGEAGARTSLALGSRHFYVPISDEEGDVLAAPFRFMLQIEAGSSLPQSSREMRGDANVLRSLGVLDDQAVLEAYKWPNTYEVLKRVQQQKLMGLLEAPGQRQRANRTS